MNVTAVWGGSPGKKGFRWGQGERQGGWGRGCEAEGFLSVIGQEGVGGPSIQRLRGGRGFGAAGGRGREGGRPLDSEAQGKEGTDPGDKHAKMPKETWRVQGEARERPRTGQG